MVFQELFTQQRKKAAKMENGLNRKTSTQPAAQQEFKRLAELHIIAILKIYEPPIDSPTSSGSDSNIPPQKLAFGSPTITQVPLFGSPTIAQVPQDSPTTTTPQVLTASVSEVFSEDDVERMRAENTRTFNANL